MRNKRSPEKQNAVFLKRMHVHFFAAVIFFLAVFLWPGSSVSGDVTKLETRKQVQGLSGSDRLKESRAQTYKEKNICDEKRIKELWQKGVCSS